MPTEKAETAMVKPPTDGTILDAATPQKNATPIVASVAPRAAALAPASALPPLQTNGGAEALSSPQPQHEEEHPPPTGAPLRGSGGLGPGPPLSSAAQRILGRSMPPHAPAWRLDGEC